jgi:hypothetical protein
MQFFSSLLGLNVSPCVGGFRHGIHVFCEALVLVAHQRTLNDRDASSNRDASAWRRIRLHRKLIRKLYILLTPW